MRRVLFATLAVLLVPITVLRAQPCSGTETLWKNDSLDNTYSPAGNTVIQSVCEGDAIGCVFTLPQGMPPQRLKTVRTGFFHPSKVNGIQALLSVEIYDGIAWTGGKPTLGAKVFDLNAAGTQMLVTTHGVNEFDLTPYLVTVGQGTGAFVVAFRMILNGGTGSCATGFPANFGTDHGSDLFSCNPSTTPPMKNLFDYQGAGAGWIDPATATVQGVPLCPWYYQGNWVIRACSEDAVCQPDLGYGGPGTAKLSVCGEALATGGKANLLLTGAAANQTSFLLASLYQNPTFVPALGGYLVPIPVLIFAPIPTSGFGQVFIPGIPGGGGSFNVPAQFIIQDPAQPKGYAVSNAVSIQFLP